LIQYVQADCPGTDDNDGAESESGNTPATNYENDEKPRIRKNIMIDVGKTFKAAACRYYPEHGVSELDAIVRELP
jgi:hypothetical protein